MTLPTQIQIEITTRCNCNCLFCVVSGGTAGRDMSWETFTEVLPLVGPGCTVALFGAGEGLLHPGFLEMAAACRERAARVMVTTNGRAVSDWGTEALRDAGVTEIAFSIVGLDAARHEALQVGVDSAEVWRNLKACADAGIPTRLVALALRSNLGELGETIARARRLGALAVTIEEILAHESWDIYPDTLRAAPDRAGMIREVSNAVASAKSLGMSVNECWDNRPDLV